MKTIEIEKRYSDLAETECCLSCGGAIDMSEPHPGETCIDLGCGKGTDLIRLREAVGEYGRVVGIDIAEGMIEKAKRTIAKFGYTNVSVVRSELEQLDLPDKIGDLIISNCTINHASNKRAVWSEIFRVLRPGGRFVVSDIYSTEPVPAEYANDPVAVAECWAGAITRGEYLAILGETGFTNISLLEESKPYQKGKISVVSFTISAKTPSCNCGHELRSSEEERRCL
jgi:arsenite methyltransferase